MNYAVRNFVISAIGIVFLVLAWAKSRLHGYSTPNLVRSEDVDGKVGYAVHTAGAWRRYLPATVEIRGRDVLELCPGSSLGTGAALLGMGAESYRAVDVFRLASTEDVVLFDKVLDLLAQDQAAADIERARSLVRSTDDHFGYRVDRSFDIPALVAGRKFDLIVSCAAFEHYDDIDATIANISKVARTGCVAAHIVDYQTHSRWVREHDPNNIYRYSEGLYRLFSFPGQPNRRRPLDYVRAFEANGWKNVRVVKAQTVAPADLARLTSGMAPPFNRPEMQMDVLAGVVIAEYPG